jgi:hypothetical protein
VWKEDVSTCLFGVGLEDALKFVNGTLEGSSCQGVYVCSRVALGSLVLAFFPVSVLSHFINVESAFLSVSKQFAV